jgi:hypothetical protein
VLGVPQAPEECSSHLLQPYMVLYIVPRQHHNLSTVKREEITRMFMPRSIIYRLGFGIVPYMSDRSQFRFLNIT